MKPEINAARLWQSLMDLARVGATPKGGVCRLALSDLDRQGRDLVCRWLREAGCSISIDPIGNVFARRRGRNDSLPPVVAGSHIDTQPSGGKFDGNYGVMAALEIVRTLNDLRIETERPFEVAIWTNEEGTRFTPVMMGSGVFAGAFTLEHALEQLDIEGKSVGGELQRIGYAGTAPLKRELAGYFEAHIEQGPILEARKKTIGVVQGALGLRWYDVTITGQDAHAGPTPMALRKDAMLAAARLVEAVHEVAMSHQPDGRGTVGFLHARPNSRNVVPGEVCLSVDLRHADKAGLDGMEAGMRSSAEHIASKTAVAIELQCVTDYPPLFFDALLVDAVRQSASELALPHMDIVSGAGHDACYVARVAPTAMIFVPCEGGISHNEIENANPEDLAAGCDVLLRAVLQQLSRA